MPLSRWVGIFGLIFLSHFLTKMGVFCAHQKGNFLNFSKLTLLLFIVHFWYPLWPVKHKRAFFFETPCIVCYIRVLGHGFLTFLFNPNDIFLTFFIPLVVGADCKLRKVLWGFQKRVRNFLSFNILNSPLRLDKMKE